jgi:hypothetical protein
MGFHEFNVYIPHSVSSKTAYKTGIEISISHNDDLQRKHVLGFENFQVTGFRGISSSQIGSECQAPVASRNTAIPISRIK